MSSATMRDPAVIGAKDTHEQGYTLTFLISSSLILLAPMEVST